MLTVYFALRIDWYTNEGHISSTANKRIDVSLRSTTQRGNIGSVHELIFNNQSATQRDCVDDSDILHTENIGVIR